MKVQAIAWDIDGTLVDSEPLHLEALLAACDQFDVDITDKGPTPFIGVSILAVWDEIKARFPRSVSRADFFAIVDQHYAANAQFLEAMPGAVEVVKAMHQRGIPQVAVSNSNRVVVDANLKQLGLNKILQWSLSLEDVAPLGKPDPLPYLLAASYLDLPPQKIVAVEDSLTGLRAARAAGCVTVAFSQSSQMSSFADFSISALSDLPELFLRQKASAVG